MNITNLGWASITIILFFHVFLKNHPYDAYILSLNVSPENNSID